MSEFSTDTSNSQKARPVEAPVAGLLHRLYELAAEDLDAAELRIAACQGLAEALAIPMAMMVRKGATGVVMIEASSRENSLWVDLHRLPERWDGALVGDGAAARAFRNCRPTVLHISEEGFLPWRVAAEQAGIRVASAWPISVPGGMWAFELFAQNDSAFEGEGGRRIAAAVTVLERFFRNAAKLEQRRLLAASMECSGNAAFITDLEGTIVWANSAFTRLSGYPHEEIIGRDPRVLRSGKQAARYYRELWTTIRSGRVFSAETVDHDRNGNAYTIRQTISPVVFENRVRYYVSIQHDITDQKAEQVRRDLRVLRDDITGLLTLAAFEKRVGKAIARNPAALALVTVSADAFYQTLSAMGEAVRDGVMRELGERISTIIDAPAIAPSTACVAGPGEFILMLVGDAARPQRTAEILVKLKKKLEAPFTEVEAQHRLEVRASIATWPDDGDSFDALVRAGDRKLVNEPVARARRFIPSN